MKALLTPTLLLIMAACTNGGDVSEAEIRNRAKALAEAADTNVNQQIAEIERDSATAAEASPANGAEGNSN